MLTYFIIVIHVNDVQPFVLHGCMNSYIKIHIYLYLLLPTNKHIYIDWKMRCGQHRWKRKKRKERQERKKDLVHYELVHITIWFTLRID